MGAAHWAWIFGVPPKIPREAADWPKEIRYYAVLQQAVSEWRIPYFVSRPIQETRKFLSIPETVLSPQVLLLRWLDADAFLFLHVVLLHGLGCVACLRLRRDHGLTPPTFVLMALLLLFNGHITAHLAIGHSMWGGYFLLPFFFALVLEPPGPPAGRWPIAVGLVLGGMLLQGSFHVFVWCVWFLLLLLAFRPERLTVAAALAWSLALGLVRLVPAAAVLLGRRDATFQTGYPGPAEIVAGLVLIRDVTFPRVGAGSMGGLQWWEFDVYVGPVAAVWLIAWGARGAARRQLAAPIVLMVLLSLTAGYRWVAAAGLPLLSTQRVSSRLLILPLGLLAVLAAIETDRWIRAGSHRRRIAVWLAAAITAVGLAAHSQAWTLARVEALSAKPPHERDLAIEIVAPETEGPKDAVYVASVRLSALASAAVLALALWRWRRVSPGSSR